jgi:hypothetical protein
MWMLKDLKIKLGQKIGLAFIFSIGLIIIGLDIIRTIKSLQATDFTEVAAYDVAEVTVSVIVGALPTYRALFNRETRPNRKASYYQDLNYGSKSKRTTRSHASGTRGDTKPLSSDKAGSYVQDSAIEHDVYSLEQYKAAHGQEHV